MMRSNRSRPLLLMAGACVAALTLSPTAGADGGGSSAGDAAYNGAPTVISGGPVPTMNGVPCVAGHLGVCTAFAQNSPRHTLRR